MRITELPIHEAKMIELKEGEANPQLKVQILILLSQ